MKIIAVNSLLIILSLVLITSCSSNKSQPIRTEKTKEIIAKLSKQKYPANLSKQTTTKLQESLPMLEEVATGLGENIKEAPLNFKPVIADNIFTLEQMITKLSNKDQLLKYSRLLTKDYLINNPIYSTSKENLDLYLLLQNNISFRNRLQQTIEQYLLEADSGNDNGFANKNLSYLKSEVFVDEEELDFYFPNEDFTHSYKNLRFGILSQVNGNVIEVRLVIANINSEGNYLTLQNPRLQTTKKVSWQRFDLLDSSELRFFSANSRKAFRYQFFINGVIDGKIGFSIKLNDQTFLLPIEYNKNDQTNNRT